MPDAGFLEGYALYSSFTVHPWPRTLDKVPRPAVHMLCKVCKSGQTFNTAGSLSEGYPISNPSSSDAVVRAVYVCASCRKYCRYFLLKFDEKKESVTKVGQEPPWDINIDRPLEKALGERAGLFKKGLISESQGYGIGAFGYYRRIVEEIIDDLLEQISGLMSGEERSKYLEALEQTKKTTIAKDKIELVKDLLPLNLRPNGMNPLSTLYSTLSQGLHQKSDEQCLESAIGVKQVLIYLVSQIEIAKTSADEFTEGMQNLLDRNKSRQG